MKQDVTFHKVSPGRKATVRSKSIQAGVEAPAFRVNLLFLLCQSRPWKSILQGHSGFAVGDSPEGQRR